MTWPGFELKTVWKKTPLRAFTNWAIGTDKKWDNFWNLWAWESERKRERVCSSGTVHLFWAPSSPLFLSLYNSLTCPIIAHVFSSYEHERERRGVAVCKRAWSPSASERGNCPCGFCQPRVWLVRHKDTYESLKRNLFSTFKKWPNFPLS